VDGRKRIAADERSDALSISPSMQNVSCSDTDFTTLERHRSLLATNVKEPPMSISVGYLLPTREGVMSGRHEAVPVVDLAERAEKAGLDSVWIGDSVTAKPRHDPITMLAAIAARTRRVQMGTAVLLPLLRNPVVLAQQLATLDQLSEGRSIIGIGIGNDSPASLAEFEAVGVPFEKRIGRFIEMFKLCRELWHGEPVTWDGRWKLHGQAVGPKAYTPGGPRLWTAGSVPASLKRCGRYFDGFFPSGPSDAAVFADRFKTVLDHARAEGRDDTKLTGAIYLTLAVNDDRAAAESAINSYLENYYSQPAEKLRQFQGNFTGPKAAAVEWLQGFVEAGATHFCLRFVGDHATNIETAAEIRAELQSS
jgi:alkanesulfonate monooxygenase SsuD/methylene tetrahydromethanopterin reductase-like flavin-dependent oxidoreductase (luciferase family)